VNGRDRWFLYLHLMDLHEYLYDEDTALFGTASPDVYDNAILHVDHILYGLFGYLAQEGYLDHTLVAVVADHGKAFGERGYEGHAREVYRETTKIPWILAFPFRLDPSAVVDVRTQNVDVWPTILDLLGLPALPRSDGRSRAPEILAAARGEAIPTETATAISHIDRYWGRPTALASPVVAVAEDGLRYVSIRGGAGRREDLFDAKSDPAELHDLSAERPEEATRLRTVADEYLKQVPVWDSAPPTLEMDEIQLNQLRALGYALP
jgi:arylsulfatase A-like enzyme